MADQVVVDNLSLSLKALQQLRSNVSRVFDSTAVEEFRNNDNSEHVNEINYVTKMKQQIVHINKDLNDLEKHGNALETVPKIGMPLGNASLLTLDPMTETSALYTDLMHAYKWTSKMHDHNGTMLQMLSANNLKRSQATGLYPAKQRRKVHAGHIVSPATIDNLVVTLKKLHPNMQIELHRPLGSPGVLQITLGRTLRAILILRGMFVESVMVKGFGESPYNEHRKLDIWSKSKHAVFRKITDNMSAAMLHFYYPTYPEMVVRSITKLLYTYGNLFSQPCKKCGRILKSGLPPTSRDMRSPHDAYHEHCR